MPRPSSVLKAPVILLVEDDAGIAILERRALERHGFGVVTVDSSSAALVQLRRQQFDLIVMDYRLPEGITGLELLAQLRSLGHNLPVVMVTGFSNEATVIEALRLGVRDFVPKSAEFLEYLPFSANRALEAVRTERELSQTQNRFRSFIDHSPSIAFVKDEDGRLVYANRKFEEQSGQTDWRGKTDSELWPAETAAEIRDHDELVLTSRKPQQFNEKLVRSDGTESFWLTYRFPLLEESGRQLLGGVAIDVSGQRQAEQALAERDQQLRQAQKMESIGQLAGGVAHDFNNLLTVILGYSEILLQESETPNCKGSLEEIRNAAERAAGLTRQLLAFSRKQVLEPKHIDLNGVVSNMKRMLQRLIGEDVQINTLLASDLHQVHADPGQMEQIVMNLAVNARDAMPQGGELGIQTANVELGKGYAASHAEVQPGNYVMLAISDSGCGMDAATQARIFEPFFTTKEIGKGTGLGLATVYGMVRQSGGYIWTYSELGIGTTFKIYLPALEVTTPTASPLGTLGEAQCGDETILLVEDEDSVRGMTRRALQSHGYKVLEASGPLEAIQISEEYDGVIHLLLTDVVMPKLNGRRLAELLQPERPEMQVIFISGYTNDTIIRNGILNQEVSFLQKPFAPATLNRKIRESLARGEALGT